MARTLKNYDHMDERISKVFAAANGYTGAQGGWIYDAEGHPIAQGWSEFYRRKVHEIRDWLTREFSTFPDFISLRDALGDYRPTIQVSTDWRKLVLAKEYNKAQKSRKDPRRAYVPDWPENIPAFHRDLIENPYV